VDEATPGGPPPACFTETFSIATSGSTSPRCTPGLPAVGSADGLAAAPGDALFATLCCLLAGSPHAACSGHGKDAPPSAAGLLPDLRSPSATVPLAPDLLVVPLALVAYGGGAGTASWRSPSGVALFASPGLLLLPVVAIWRPAPVGVYCRLRAAVLAGADAWRPGSASRFRRAGLALGIAVLPRHFLDHPVSEGLRRTLNWAGFHAALAAGAAVYWWRTGTGRLSDGLLAADGLVSVAAAAFFPRYYFAVLPVLVLARPADSPGDAAPCQVLVLLAALCIRRFGLAPDTPYRPRPSGRAPVRVAGPAMFDDCRAAASILATRPPRRHALVWGYRPNSTSWLACPPPTVPGLPAVNRRPGRPHLSISRPPPPAGGSQPPHSPPRSHLRCGRAGPLQSGSRHRPVPDLRAWFAHYELIAETPARASTSGLPLAEYW